MACNTYGVDCRRERLCDVCLAAERRTMPGQAHSLGQQWAESICRGELRTKEWSDVDSEKANRIARAKVLAAFFDERLVDELAPGFLRGAAEWWGRRPMRYRDTGRGRGCV